MPESSPPDRKPVPDGTIPMTPPGAGRGGKPVDKMLNTVIDGRFRVRATLGEGGMGKVYLAEDEKLNRRRVALKIMAGALTTDPEFRARFHREALLQANLPHPQIVQVIDVGETPDGAYIAMEYSDGQALATLIRELGPRPLEKALDITAQILEVLDFAHRQGVIHRDLKPGNILIEERAGREFVRVLDFGIAKLMSKDGSNEHQLTLTKAGTTYGTLGYMAPEQACGDEKIDHRADVYSVGIILHEMLTGKVPAPPEARTHPVRYAMWVAQNPVKSIRETHPDLDLVEEVDNIIRNALRREPAKRYASALAFLNAIREFRASAQAATMRRAEVGGRLSPTQSMTGTARMRVGKAAGIAWLLFVLALAGGAFGWWQHLEGKKTVENTRVEMDEALAALKKANAGSGSLKAGIAELAARAAGGGDANLGNRITELEDKVRVADQRAVKAEADAKKAREDLAKTPTGAGTPTGGDPELKNELERFKKAAETEKSRADKAEGEVTLAQKEASELKAELAKRPPAGADVNAEIARLKGEVQASNEAKKTAETDRDRIAEEAGKLRTQLEAIKTDPKGPSAEAVAKLTKDLEEAQKRNKSLESKATESKEAEAKSRIRVGELEETAKEAQRKAAESAQRVTEREATIASRDQRIRELESRPTVSSTDQSRINQLESDLNREREASRQASQRASSAEQEASRFRQDLERANQEIQRIRSGGGNSAFAVNIKNTIFNADVVIEALDVVDGSGSRSETPPSNRLKPSESFQVNMNGAGRITVVYRTRTGNSPGPQKTKTYDVAPGRSQIDITP